MLHYRPSTVNRYTLAPSPPASLRMLPCENMAHMPSPSTATPPATATPASRAISQDGLPAIAHIDFPRRRPSYRCVCHCHPTAVAASRATIHACATLDHAARTSRYRRRGGSRIWARGMPIPSTQAAAPAPYIFPVSSVASLRHSNHHRLYVLFPTATLTRFRFSPIPTPTAIAR